MIGFVEREQRFGLLPAVFDDERFEQLLLARKVGIERALRHTRRANDVADAGAVETVLQEDPARALHDLLPLGGLADRLACEGGASGFPRKMRC